MKQISQKIIASILIIGLILSLNLNLIFLKPKQANALDGGGSWAEAIKDIVLDAVGWTLTDLILKRLEAKIIAWGQGRETDAMEPFAVTDWLDYFKNALIIGTARYVAEYDAIWDLTDEFDRRMRSSLDALGFGTYYNDFLPYRYYARPTLREDLGINYQPFINSGYSLLAGGWKAWFSLLKPQNNIFGQTIMAAAARRKYIEAEEQAKDKETDVSGGYKSEVTTTKTDIDACEEHCQDTYGVITGPPSPELQDCLNRCNTKLGIPLENQVKNLGTDINKYMTDALGKDMNRIISADEITELLGVIFSALLNKAIHGLGLAFSPKKVDTTTEARSEYKQAYSYYRAFKKEQTQEDIKDIRSVTATNILKSIQQLSRSIISCEKNEMMKQEDYAKNLADIFNAQVEALYIGLEGVNLKPDFEVLDPRFAPYSVYGYSWGNVPSAKFPSKCRKITDELNLGPNATCRWISSGLEPNYDPNCEQCMYDHDSLNCPPAPYPPQPYPATGIEPWTQQQFQQKSDFWWGCKNQYNAILDRCGECLKRADEKCNDLTNQAQKDQCIQNHCNNYGNLSTQVVQPIIDGLDFYNKCLMEEKKEACYTCLREYFMPATYCEQTRDYIARSIIKYPTVVLVPRSWLIGDTGMWIGPYDETMGAMGGKCDDNHGAESIDVALICRIMPEYEFGGQKICRTMCSGVTEEQLRDTTDFRPHGLDCNRARIAIGGKEPWATINDGLLHLRAKCCAEGWQYDTTNYAICVGSGPVTQEEPPNEVVCGTADTDGDGRAEAFYEAPEFCCGEGFRPVTTYFNTREGLPRYYCTYERLQFGSGQNTSPGSGEIYVCSNVATGGASMFLGTGNCGQKSSCRSQTPTAGPRVIGVAGNRVQCSDDCNMSLSCQQRVNDNSCTIWEVDEGGCNPCGQVPSGIICSKETVRQEQGDAVATNESRTMRCNLSGTTGQLNLSLYLDELADIIEKWDNPTGALGDWAIGAQACMRCNSSDPGYPYYGYYDSNGNGIDQCNNKDILNRRRCGDFELASFTGNEADVSCSPGNPVQIGTSTAVCGNGIIEPPTENCEQNSDCPSSETCQGCVCVSGGAVCGDGVITSPEVCEIPDIGCKITEECEADCSQCIPLVP